jgi:hypothetical protein
LPYYNLRQLRIDDDRINEASKLDKRIRELEPKWALGILNEVATDAARAKQARELAEDAGNEADKKMGQVEKLKRLDQLNDAAVEKRGTAMPPSTPDQAALRQAGNKPPQQNDVIKLDSHRTEQMKGHLAPLPELQQRESERSVLKNEIGELISVNKGEGVVKDKDILFAA